MIVGRRRPLLLTVGVVLLAVLIFLAMRGSGPPGFDTSIHGWLLRHRHSWATHLAKAATTAGSSPVLYAVLAALTALLWWRQRRLIPQPRWRPVIALAVFTVGQLLRTSLSAALHRARPPVADWIQTATGWSMPSGHSSNSALAALLVLWVHLAVPAHAHLTPVGRPRGRRVHRHGGVVPCLPRCALADGRAGRLAVRRLLGRLCGTDPGAPGVPVLAPWLNHFVGTRTAAVLSGSGAQGARPRRSGVGA